MIRYQLISHYYDYEVAGTTYNGFTCRCVFDTRDQAINFYNKLVKPDVSHIGSYLVRIKEHVYA